MLLVLVSPLQVGLEHEACVDKMRLLTLTSLATQNAEVSYAEVAANLLIGASRSSPCPSTALRHARLQANVSSGGWHTRTLPPVIAMNRNVAAVLLVLILLQYACPALGRARGLSARAPPAHVPAARGLLRLLSGEDEVEEWVIRAISEELIEARMNQLLGVVMIMYALAPHSLP